MSRRRILVVEPSRRAAKEPLVRALAQQPDIELVFASGLTDLFDFTWIRPYASDLITFSYWNDDLVEAVRRHVARTKADFAGVLTYVDFAIPATNRLQHELGLPRLCGGEASRLRNKYAVRQLLAACPGVRQPHAVKIAELAEARQFCDEGRICFPAVVKPTEFCGALATRIVRNPDELLSFVPRAIDADFPDERLRRFIPGLERAAIVESFVGGEQFSAEIVVSRGQPRLFGITHKKIIEMDGHPVATSHHFPADEHCATHAAAIQTMIMESHASLALENTCTNVDFRVDAQGPALIEINARIGGDVLPALFALSHGMQIGQLLTAVALGEEVVPPRPAPGMLTPVNAFHFNVTLEGIVEHVAEASPLPDSSIVPDVLPGDFLVKRGLCSAFRVAHEITTRSTARWSEHAVRIRRASGVFELGGGEHLMVVGATSSDVPEMTRVEQAAWPPYHAAAPETIRKRIGRDPAGTVVAFTVSDRKLVGFFTGVRLAAFTITDIRPWTYYAGLAESDETLPEESELPFLKGVSLTVDPNAPRGTAPQLMRGAQRHFRSLGVHIMVTLGRPVGYAAAKRQGCNFPEYYADLLASRRKDPTFSVFKRAGATPAGYLPRFFNDPESDDFGLVFIHDLMNRNER